MFQIQRYEEESSQGNSSLANERLVKINDKFKRKRTTKEKASKKTQADLKKTVQPESHKGNAKNNEDITNTFEIDTIIKENELEDEGLNLNLIHQEQYEEGHIEDFKVLHAFPTFDKPKQTPQETAAVKLLGIPDWLANPTVIDPETTLPIDDSSLGLSDRLRNRCKTLGINECFAVQTAVIPLLIHNRRLSDVHMHPGDICVSAPTGSGKTLAYVLPIIEILSKRIITRLRALVVLPTRDLVAQVKETFIAFCKGTSLKIGVVTGQQSFIHEQEQIVFSSSELLMGGKSKIDILIATPGRLIEHLSMTPNFTLQHLRFLIIDEADRLLNQSYQDWLIHILRSTQQINSVESGKDTIGINLDSIGASFNNDDAISSSIMGALFNLPKMDASETKVSAVQKLLFSATLTRNPAKIASLRLVNPQYISVQSLNKEEGEIKYTLPTTLKEFMIVTSSSMKPLIVLHLLHNLHIKSALCFTKSVDSAHRLAKLIQLFENSNFKESIQENDNMIISTGSIIAAEYSSDLTKDERKNILNKFKRGDIRLLICSDLIARGMDLDRVDTVINYDNPIYMKKYVHRVGRTARAGRNGDAYSLVETQEVRYFKDMLRKAGHLDKVQNINIKATLLDPMKDAYQQALNAFKEYMNDSRPHAIKYQQNDSIPMETDENDIQNEDENILLLI
ncbi:6375_t:CDS:10 [Funneliformis geosporum]|uniref:ATP-dependent RNA helicase n=1 Tax=Funneliformis geosporum TaxID=1117311 RepID=A0A9W4WN25_9GLOM|nr:6375_t:CDS:10 [Funneliformis geosporum]CAI2166193.1 3819_t:CDS:10 [Funneliformis geosporum]